MAKITHSTGETHPSGWFKFAVLRSEIVDGEYKGKKSKRVKFEVQSTERKEDGGPFILAVWTGTVLSDHPNCKLKQLVEACDVDLPSFADTDELDGCIFAGKVEEGDNGYSNIVAFDSKDRVRQAGKSAKTTKAAKPKARDADDDTVTFNDPFADE